MTYPLAVNGNSGGLIWTRQVEVRLRSGHLKAPKGGFLGKVRRFTPSSAAALGLLFTLHCSRVTVSHPARRAGRLPSTATSDARGYEETGEASWYGGNGDGFSGKPTASGEIFNPQDLTCAHRTLPLGTYLEVENLDNGNRIVVRVNDRGPFAKGRILDLSKRAALDLGFLAEGFTQVAIRTVDGSGAPKALDPALDHLNPYTIQVAALAEKANIERLTKDLEQASFGPVSLMDAVARDGRPVKRVRAGNYLRLTDAEQAADKVAKFFKDRGVEPFITRQR
ncbi:MAG: septal ring lytic transglycosylase RlpA family protein [Acidobacteriota bacterium]|nr:septal ring lytic transglycosylase RlpA family protein [Acidobacteriota bacterium]